MCRRGSRRRRVSTNKSLIFLTHAAEPPPPPPGPREGSSGSLLRLASRNRVVRDTSFCTQHEEAATAEKEKEHFSISLPFIQLGNNTHILFSLLPNVGPTARHGDKKDILTLDGRPDLCQIFCRADSTMTTMEDSHFSTADNEGKRKRRRGRGAFPWRLKQVH